MERMPKTPCPFAVVFGIMSLFLGTAEAGSGEQDITLQGNRQVKCESFKADGTVAGARAHVRAPLSVFLLRHLTASFEIGERRFPFSDGCRVIQGTQQFDKIVLHLAKTAAQGTMEPHLNPRRDRCRRGVSIVKEDSRVRRVLYVQTGDILNTERNAARVLFCERKGQ